MGRAPVRRVAIVADSIGCIPGDLVRDYGIEIVAPNIYWKGAVYRDWLDITPRQAYELLQKDPDAFSTASPSPGARPTVRANTSTRAARWPPPTPQPPL